MQPLRRVSQMRQKVFLRKAIEKVSNTKENWRRRANLKVSKPFYISILSKLQEQIVSSFLAADIPLHKLNHPSLKSLFARMGKVLPSETAARACVAKLASQQEEQNPELLHDKKIFLIVDEAEVAKQKYISVLVGSLDAPNQTFLVNCHPLESDRNVNSSIILHTVDDILRQLEIKRENFSLLLTDAARYMSLAGKTLKESDPSLMHVTCIAHLLHNCAMRVRAHFKNIDEVMATIKTATIKNKDRKKDFHNAGLPSPPDPVITRWATWLRAALYYSENLPAVRTIVNNWTSAGLLAEQKTLSMWKVWCRTWLK